MRARRGEVRAGPRAEPRPARKPGLAARRAAADLVEGVLDRGRTLAEQGGPEGPLAPLAQVDRARAQSLATLTLRHLARIDALLDGFLRRRPPGRAMTALRIAAAEIVIEGVAPHAAVDAAVTLARAAPRSRHLAPVVNAVARRLAGEGAAEWERLPSPALPDWLAGPVAACWGEDVAAAIAAAHLAPAPLDLTPRRPDEAPTLAGRLGARLLPTGSLRLAGRAQVSALPGFAEGAWWVQDAASALPARFLAPRPGERILDLCAAPGGKTMQLAAAGARVTALDISAERMARLRANLARTGLAADLVIADALDWQPPGSFDAILLDAPCSATGTMRRHPDLAHLPGRAEIAPLLEIQRRLIDRAFGWLRPGGRLVYAVCSLLPAEGERQAAAFLARTPDAVRLPAAIPGLPEGWLDRKGALRTRPDFWPDLGGVDGFYAALIGRRGA